MSAKKRVVIGFAGAKLDAKQKPSRWEEWRPSVALTQIPDFHVDRFELLYNGDFDWLVNLLAKDIAVVSPATEVVGHKLGIADPWEPADVFRNLLEFARAYKFDIDKEDYFVHITTGTHIMQIALFNLTKARYLPGHLLQTAPPKRRGDPPGYECIDLDLSKYDELAQVLSLEHAEATAVLKSGIETRNHDFNTMIEELEAVGSRSRDPILLQGPTGAGKTILASRIAEIKKTRRQITGKFVAVNCKTLQGETAASTLFGHVRGAYTGATADRPGLLRSAHKGIVFLDEVGTLNLDMQAMLLKALEEKRVRPVGSDDEVSTDFQIICATNVDLAAEVAAGRFREDLATRLCYWVYDLPGLAERPEDIEPNVDYVLQRYAAENGQMARFNKEARAKYLAFAVSPDALWRGNFRDLSASVGRMATLAPAGRITEAVVELEIVRLRRLWKAYSSNQVVEPDGARALEQLLTVRQREAIDLVDLVQLQAVVSVCRRSRSMADAGRKLYAVSREAKAKPNDSDRLQKYLAKFGLAWKDVVG